MFGKAALLLILGFSLIFVIFGQNFGSVTTRAVDNFTEYYTESNAHNIAVSGANMAANQIFFDPTWTTGYDDVPYSEGTINVSVEVLDVYKNIRKVTSTGTYGSTTNTVSVILSPSKFSKFAYYSISEGSSIWWYGTDTVWGPFHTQDYLRCAQHPVFKGPRTTTKKTLKYYSSKSADKPYISGDFQSGVNLPLPTDGITPLKGAAEEDGYKFTGHDTVYITFATDSIKYKYTYNGAVTTAYSSTFAPNGVIFAENAVVRLKGTVHGQYSVVASGSGGKGTIWLDDNIVYSSDPRVNPSSSDLLGILAKNNVWITKNTLNNDDINIHASIYCETGGFGAQDYDTRPVSGDINLLGGIIQNTRKAVGTFGGSGIEHGFSKRYRYDERLLVASPPFFPGTGAFEIVSWLE